MYGFYILLAKEIKTSDIHWLVDIKYKKYLPKGNLTVLETTYAIFLTLNVTKNYTNLKVSMRMFKKLAQYININKNANIKEGSIAANRV